MQMTKECQHPKTARAKKRNRKYGNVGTPLNCGLRIGDCKGLRMTNDKTKAQTDSVKNAVENVEMARGFAWL
jgi:hypothetical protein